MPLSTTSCLGFWVNQIKVFCAKLRCAHVKIRNFALFKTAYMERPKHSLITCETHPFVHCQETKRSEVKRIEAVTTLLKQINYKLLRLYIKKKLTKPEKKKKKRRANKDTYDHCARSGTNRRIENDVKAIDKGI